MQECSQERRQVAENTLQAVGGIRARQARSCRRSSYVRKSDIMVVLKRYRLELLSVQIGVLETCTNSAPITRYIP